MLKITVCIGSSCHIKGSRQVVEQLQTLIAENNVGDKVELGGTFFLLRRLHIYFEIAYAEINAAPYD